MSDGAAVLLETEGLTTVFGGQRRFLQRPTPVVRAVTDVTMSVAAGESLGIVGESGCGKSTLAKTLLGLIRETAGTIRLDGRTVSGLDATTAREVRADIQYVHQDPGAALDPWWRVGDTLDETLAIRGVGDRRERAARIDEMLETVGLEPATRRRYPHELSGGQQRRVGLARMLSLRPRIVILDEPTSGLDLSVQASVLALIQSLRERFAVTFLFISHDLSVVRRVCDRVAVMYLGRIVEIAPTETLFEDARHPYTQGLFASAPSLHRHRADEAPLAGDPPSPTNIPTGCAFRSRCPIAMDSCADAVPPLTRLGSEHHAACFAARPD